MRLYLHATLELTTPTKMQKRNQILSFYLSLAVLSNKREKTTHLTAVKFIVISSIQLHYRYFLYENILHVFALCLFLLFLIFFCNLDKENLQ